MGTLEQEILDADVGQDLEEDADAVPSKHEPPPLRMTYHPPFEYFSNLEELNLSRTSIQSLPPSFFKLRLLVKLILQECSMLMELPPEIGALKNLKMFDLEGTEIMYLPKEMEKLEKLECLRVSLCVYADKYIYRNGIENVIPRSMISKFSKLEELSICVNSDAKWWEVEVLEAVLKNLHLLPFLGILKLYLPTPKALQCFLQLRRQIPIYSCLHDFRLTIGESGKHDSFLPTDLVASFEKLEKCVKYENGEGIKKDIVELIKHARALFVCRHWTIQNLSIFDTCTSSFCLLSECNELLTIIDGHDYNTLYACEYLVYLGIHYMKKLQTIWEGPVTGYSFVGLQVLALHTCPELTTIITEGMLKNLQNLREVIVEDCPKVQSLVSLESTPTRVDYGQRLHRLRRILLLDLPELVSISGGENIMPHLKTLLILNCLKLEHLSVKEIPSDIKEIKGETEWWYALKSGRSEYSGAFVPLRRDGNLMNQLAKDKNSLERSYDLRHQEMIYRYTGISELASEVSTPPREAIDTIRTWGTTAENGEYVFAINRKTIYHYLGAIHDIQSYLNSAAAASDDLSMVKSVMQLAMSRLMDEFRNILRVNGKSKEHDLYYDDPSISMVDLTLTQGASSSVKAQEDDFVKTNSMSPDMISFLRRIAERAISAGYLRTCVEVYISERKTIMQTRFQQFNMHKGSEYSEQRFEWGMLESQIEVWIESVKINFKYLFATEKRLCGKIFPLFGINTEEICFMVTFEDYEIQAENLVTSLSRINPPPEKVFRILDLYETLYCFLSEMRSVAKCSMAFRNRGTQLLPVLADIISNSLSMFEMALLYHESSVIFVGSVDPLINYVMSYLHTLCDYKLSLWKLSLPKLPSIDGYDVSLETEEFKGQSELSCHLIWIIMMLVSNLESQAKLCEDGSAGHFFAMKNYHYIVHKIDISPELREVVGDDYFGKLIQKLNQAKAKYLMLELKKIRDMRGY